MKSSFLKVWFLGFLIVIFSILSGCKVNKEFVSAKMVSVNDFGAKANDGIDDTKNIQDALNHLDTIGGGMLNIPEGTFIISRKSPQKAGCIYLPSNVQIVGAGQKKTILKLQTKQGNYTRLIYIKGEKNVSLSRLTIDGNRWEQPKPEAPNEHLHGIFIDSSIDVLIRDCTFQNTGGDGILIHGPRVQSKNITIRNCAFKDNRRNGITLGSGFNGVVIDSCYFEATNIYGSPIDSEPDNGKCENAKFTNNIVVSNKKNPTLITLGGHVPVVGYEVSNNKLENCGLHLVRAYDAEIFNNEISVKGKRTPGIKSIYVSKNIDIYNNTIHSEADGIQLIATNQSHPSDFIIRNNTIEVSREGAVGVRIQGTKNVEIKENGITSIFPKGSNIGLYVRSTRDVDNIKISGNKIKNFNNGLNLVAYAKYTLTNITFEDNLLDINEKGEIIKYNCLKNQIGSQVTVVDRNNKRTKIEIN